MNDPFSSRLILLVVCDSQYSFSRCFMVMVQNVRGFDRGFGQDSVFS